MTWIRHALDGSTLVSELAGHALLARGSLGIGRRAQQLEALLDACGRTGQRWTRQRLQHELQPFLVGSERELARRERIGWHRYGAGGGVHLGAKARPAPSRLLLKAPRERGEKGVLYCPSEQSWMQLLCEHDAAAVLSEYHLVGQTTRSPTDFASLAGFAGLSRDPLFIGVSNLSDLEALGLLRPVVEPLPILASDWVDPDTYAPQPLHGRSIDVLMVASWAEGSRHRWLFEVLGELPRSLRVVLVGRDAGGRTAGDVRVLARALGVRQELELHTDLPWAKVVALQCDARIAVVLDRRGGSGRVTSECLFAGAPVAMTEDSHLGSRAYLNGHTGVLLSRPGLGWQLLRFWREAERFTPRAWAEKHISYRHGWARLNATLRAWTEATGRPWTADIAGMCWREGPALMHREDQERLAPAVEALRRRHGVEAR
jgi:hypothetical protein